MTRHTQAHLSRTLKKNEPQQLKQKTLNQMQYYMGAKLIEIGIEPKSAIYRWSVQNNDDEQICTISAFWGDSKEKLLSGNFPLTGAELIDCARANVSAGVEKAAVLCGYGAEIDRFQEALKHTGEQMGLEIESLHKLTGKPQG
jgi:hypothetical protein